MISEWLGTTEGFVDASVRAQVSGYLIARDYEEGQLVKKGDLLFRIDPRPFQAALDQAQGQLASARATLERERLDVVRYTPLVKQGAVSQQEYDNAVQNERGAQASVQAAQAAVEAAKINLGFTEIRSPVDGIVGVAQAQLGDFVGPSSAEPLTAVSQLDPIRVSFPVSEQEYLHFAPRVEEALRVGHFREGKLELILADGSIYPHRGTGYPAGLGVDPRTGTITGKGSFRIRDTCCAPASTHACASRPTCGAAPPPCPSARSRISRAWPRSPWWDRTARSRYARSSPGRARERCA